VRLEIEELVDAAHRAGRQAAQRNTSYEIIREFPDHVSSPPPELLIDLAYPGEEPAPDLAGPAAV